MPGFTLSDNHEYFIAISMVGEHTFITFGVHDHSDNKTHTLGYIGKKLRYPKDYHSAGRFNSIFSTCSGVLTQDYKFKNSNEHQKQLEFGYKAFAISLDDYLTFVSELQLLLQGKYSNFTEEEKEAFNIQLYYPTQQKNEFALVDLENIPLRGQESHYTGKTIEELNVFNNCRHTAIDLISSFLPSGKSYLKGISTYAYQEMPYKATFKQDQITDSFYILPVPPNSKNMDKSQYKTLKMIYAKLQDIPLKNPGSDVTKRKFEAAKALYQSISANHKPNNLSELLETVDTWETQNHQLIDTRRKNSCFSNLNLFNTGTRSMLEKIKDELKSSQKIEYPKDIATENAIDIATESAMMAFRLSFAYPF